MQFGVAVVGASEPTSKVGIVGSRDVGTEGSSEGAIVNSDG